MNQFLHSSDLKALARGQLFGKYGILIGAAVLMQLCILPFSLAISFLLGTDTVLTVLLSSAAQFLLQLYAGFLNVGEACLYLKTACGQKPAFSDLFRFFKGDTSKVIHLQVIIGGISVLCSLPYLIVGVFVNRSLDLVSITTLSTEDFGINPVLFLVYVVLYVAGTAISLFASLMLSQVYYLMLDFPEYSASQLLKMSIRLMKGNKGRLFYIQLSFLPLLLLCLPSLGLALLWIYPYMQTVYADFYLDLVKKSKPASV